MDKSRLRKVMLALLEMALAEPPLPKTATPLPAPKVVVNVPRPQVTVAAPRVQVRAAPAKVQVKVMSTAAKLRDAGAEVGKDGRERSYWLKQLQQPTVHSTKPTFSESSHDFGAP